MCISPTTPKGTRSIAPSNRYTRVFAIGRPIGTTSRVPPTFCTLPTEAPSEILPIVIFVLSARQNGCKTLSTPHSDTPYPLTKHVLGPQKDISFTNSDRGQRSEPTTKTSTKSRVFLVSSR